MTLIELFALLKKHLKLVIALPVVCGIAMLAYSYLAMGDEYTASTSLYVLSKADGTAGVSSTDLSASQLIANDVAELIKSDRVMDDTARALNLESLSKYKIAVTSQTTTRVITLSVTGPDAQGSANVANELARNSSTVAREVMNVDSINVVDQASAPKSPSGPKRTLYAAVAAVAGLFAAAAIVVLQDILDTRVRNAEDLENLLGIPVIGRIPAMKGGK